MRIDVVTLFPEFFEGPLATGLVGKALARGEAEVGFVNPRDFTHDVHRSVDDTPYGGGAGMVMKPEPMAQAIEAARARGGGPVLLMSPQGRHLTQADLGRWARHPHLVMVAGRYEGFDERIRGLVDEEVSLGDFVLTGGEYAALTLIDGLVRLLPGTLGNQASSEGDSFSDGLLEHPQYTRPPVFRGQDVPAVLQSGDHARIHAWRRAQAVLRTRARRPDLLARIPLAPADREALWSEPSPAAPLALAVAMPADPEALADLAGLAASYALTRAFVVPAPGVAEADLSAALAEAPERAWPVPLWPRKRRNYEPAPIRVAAAERLTVASSFEALAADPGWALVGIGRRPAALDAEVLPPEALRAPRPDGRVWTLAVGPGLVDPKGNPSAFLAGILPSVRAGTREAGLTPMLLAAVLVDRVRGEA
ncbi:MAG: tRNA (guanosine(37)-N1)-methyltransferase TrmD [Myxococcales bacterium]|nr:tRNA (guanosine(37)-N1)-methyltransferase TrmD [Myxococcales bacterium]